jgi:lipid-A-disaccharide synthase
MKYYIIAGEASGDLHGSNLIKELKMLDLQADIRAWGGDMMQEQGATIVKHYRELAFMGFMEVITNLGAILKNIKFCKQDILAFNPDAVIFIDYPGFNLRIAKWAKLNGLKTIYYISPQLWAWKEGRVNQVKRDIDKMLVILPFEEEFYQKHNFKVEFTGHPLLDVVEGFKAIPNTDQDNRAAQSIIALLPGSRKQEISKMLPIMLKMKNKFPAYKFIIAGAPSMEDSFYREIIKGQNIEIVKNSTYQLLSRSYAAIVTSGTATLETALFGVPEIVCYKGSSFSYAIAKRIVKVPFISLVNLIAGKEILKELIQDNFNEASLTLELGKILNDKVYRDTMVAELNDLHKQLGGRGASARAASIIYKFVAKGL